jgi:hypothetical protein
MKFLKAAFWAIILAEGVSLLNVVIIIQLTTGTRAHFMNRSVIYWMTLVPSFLSLFYSAVIGYIWWLFRERRWIVWSAYLYIIPSLWAIWMVFASPGKSSSFNYVLTEIIILYSSITWMLVKAPPIAAPARWLGITYLASMAMLYYVSFVTYAKNPALFYLFSTLLPMVPPLLTLLLIQRAQRWIGERRQLEKEVDALTAAEVGRDL